MNPNDLQRHLIDKIRDALGDAGNASIELQQPKDLGFGDVALPCFQLAKTLGQAPPQAAAAIAAKLRPDAVLAAASAAGPFVNLRYQRDALAEAVCTAALRGEVPFGPWPRNGRTVVIDFSSPNIAKPFHIGHLRSTVIGAALRRIHHHTGARAIGVNHLGDWGAQFGKILTAWKRWGDEQKLDKEPMRHLHEIYVRYDKEKTEALDAESARHWQRLESGEDNEERRLWQRLRDISLQAFQGPYRRLRTEFDSVAGESFYEDKVEAAIQRVVQSGCTEMSEGALIVDLSKQKMPPLILRKSDGTTIYATRDLAALFYRKQTYDFDRALYVVGGEQKLHFRQLVETLRRMGLDWADSVEHVDFGLVLFKDDDSGRWVKGKSRAGNIVFLDEVLDEAVANIRAKIAEKNPGLENPDAVAESLGVSAIVFNDLKNTRAKDVKFDWDEMLSFDGETGPYVQYAGARLCSILRKAGVELDQLDPSSADWNQLADAERVLLAMHEFGPAVQRAAERNEPYLITNLMIRIAGEIHGYLRDHHVLRAEEPTRTARLLLVGAARRALEAGLGLLGVAAPQAM